MCGIGGLSLARGQTIDEGSLRSLGDALVHRGPDASGTWTSTTGNVGLAHTRLSLFDLTSAANQPWIGGDDALVFNGEIYNFRSLRAELETSGATFDTESDTEVLFAVLRTFGVRKALDRIEGMFAFAYYHGASSTTYLVRDRYGIKPLLYARRQGGFVFSSEVKGLLTAQKLEVDTTLALLALRTLGDKSPTRTLFRGVKQVGPGCLVALRDGQVCAEETYAPLLDIIDETTYHALERQPFDEITEQLDDLLSGAVDRMSACDARLGAFFSGGVDSSLICGVAQNQGHRDFRAFTSEVAGPASELATARGVARTLQLPFDSVRFEPEDWIRDWVRCTWHLETPIITNPSTIPFAQVAKLAHDAGYKAVLTGEGADELFLGYPRLASRGAERLAGAPLAALRKIYRRVPGLADAILNERDTTSNDFLRNIVGGFEEDRIQAAAEARYAFLEPITAQLQARSASMLQTSLQALLQRNDRMGMSASIESRFPFLDEKVVQFALNLPLKHKLRRSAAVHDPKHPFVIDKAPVRSVAARYLPATDARRRKQGFPTQGLHGVCIRQGAFEGGWVAGAFGGGSTFDAEMAAWPQAYDVAKLTSIEIFGRLFGRGEPVGEVEEWLRDSARAV